MLAWRGQPLELRQSGALLSKTGKRWIFCTMNRMQPNLNAFLFGISFWRLLLVCKQEQQPRRLSHFGVEVGRGCQGRIGQSKMVTSYCISSKATTWASYDAMMLCVESFPAQVVLTGGRWRRLHGGDCPLLSCWEIVTHKGMPMEWNDVALSDPATSVINWLCPPSLAWHLPSYHHHQTTTTNLLSTTSNKIPRLSWPLTPDST